MSAWVPYRVLRQWTGYFSGAALALTSSMLVAAQDPPAIDSLRYGEDYSYLAEPVERSGEWWEPLKYIPLDETGSIYITFADEVRLRYELLRNDNFGDGPQDNDGYLWLRALPVTDLHAGEHLRFFGQFITAFEIDREPFNREIDENRVDFLQLFADIKVPFPQQGHGTIRAGRQMLNYTPTCNCS